MFVSDCVHLCLLCLSACLLRVVYVCMFVYVCVRVCMLVYVCVCAFVLCMTVYVCGCVCMFGFVCVCLRVVVYVYVWLCALACG